MRYFVLVLVCGLAVAAHAEQPRSAPRGSDPERDRTMLKARLENRLAETQQMQERLETALSRLEEGASTAEVRAHMETPGDNRELRRPDRAGAPGMPGRREGRWAERLSDEQRQAFGRYVQEHAPDLAGRLATLREEHPLLADRMLNRMEPRLRLLMAEEDREMRELRLQEIHASWDVLAASRSFAEALREDSGSPKAQELAANLRTVLGQQFDLRQAIHQREIQLLERRLAELRRELEEHLATRDQLVERRVEGVTRIVRERADSEPDGK